MTEYTKLNLQNGDTLTAEHIAHIEDGIVAANDAIEQVKISGELDGQDGGFYTPIVDQTDAATMRISFTPSKADMPGIASTNVTLPAGVSATHQWNGTVLTVTSASGTSGADLKGDAGDDGGYYTIGVEQTGDSTMRLSFTASKEGMPSIASVNVTLPKAKDGTNGVSPTVTTSKSGKITTMTITDKNGTRTATINDGADGKTPVKGQDYWTDIDQLEMFVDVIEETKKNFPMLATESEEEVMLLESGDIDATLSIAGKVADAKAVGDRLVQKQQLKPEFANSIEECTDTSKLYVLPDGHIYAYMTTTVIVPGSTKPNFTNLLEVEGAEIKRNVRYSKSADTFSTADGIDSLIVPIPTSGTITIRCKSCGRCISYANAYGGTDKSTFQTDIITSIGGWSYDSADSSIVYFTFTNSTGLKYLVFMSDTVDTSTDIVTANEEITYTTTEDTTETTEAWTNTGHPFAFFNEAGDILTQVKVEFVDTIDECIDTSKIYVLPDGYIYAYMRHETTTEGGTVENYTNRVPTSTDTDGSIYNGVGYKEDVRLSSSGGVSSSAQEGSVLTGFIPFTRSDVLRLKGATWLDGTFPSGQAYYLNYYDSSKTFVWGLAASAHATATGSLKESVTYDESTGVTEASVDGLDGVVGAEKLSKIAYVRLCAYGKGADLIVTVNEEITETTIEGGMKPNFTNLLTHPDTVITKGKRFSQSSNEYKDLSGCDAVIIPLPESADASFTIRCRGCGYYRSGNTMYQVGYFSADKTTWYYPIGDNMAWTTDGNGDEVVTSTPKDGNANKYLVLNMNTVDTTTAIITVNQEITYTTVEGGTTVSYKWASTGHAFVPADYEDRIITLETETDRLNGHAGTLKKDVAALKESVTDLETDVAALKERPASSAISMMVYAPSPQLPADGSETADFDATNIAAGDIYTYIDALVEKYPQYLTKETLGKDESGEYDWNRYTASRRTYDAWVKPTHPAMYAWVNGSTVIYSVSVSPRVGDTMYSTAYISTAYSTVTAVDTPNQTRTVNGLTFTSDKTKDVAPTLVYTLSDYSPYRLGAYATWHNTVYNASRASIGKIASIANGTLTDSNGNAYQRYPMGDRNKDFKRLPVLVIGSNEHGGNSSGDPAEPAIISARLIKDLCECRNADNPFLNMLKSEYLIVFCPVINPWGFGKDNGYVNARNVNLDRNFDTPGWGKDSDTRHGAYGGSENETQYFMNTLYASGAKIALANHGLGDRINPDTGEGVNAGLCSYMVGRNQAKYTAPLAAIAETMNVNYGLSFYDMGQAPGDTYGKTRSYMDHIGIEGGAVEMSAIDGYLLHGGARHTAKVLEADYTLLLQFLQMLIDCQAE